MLIFRKTNFFDRSWLQLLLGLLDPSLYTIAQQRWRKGGWSLGSEHNFDGAVQSNFYSYLRINVVAAVEISILWYLITRKIELDYFLDCKNSKATLLDKKTLPTVNKLVHEKIVGRCT